MAITSKNDRQDLDENNHLRACGRRPRRPHYNGGDDLSLSSTNHTRRHHYGSGGDELSMSHHTRRHHCSHHYRGNCGDEYSMSSTQHPHRLRHSNSGSCSGSSGDELSVTQRAPRQHYANGYGDEHSASHRHYRHQYYGNEEISMSSAHSSLMSSSHCPSLMSASSHSSSVHSSISGDSSHSLDFSNSSRGSSAKFQHSYKKPTLPLRSEYVALDCEMVGSHSGKSMCARVVCTNWKAKIIYDSYVQPTEPVADYRTFISGITAADLEGAPTLDVVRAEVEELLVGKILVGHGLENDLSSLRTEHPWWQVRDTAYYPPFQKQRIDPNTGESYNVPSKLKDLCWSKLQREIQIPGQAHSPAEDAIAALDLYKSHRPRWEACVTSQMQQMQRTQRNFLTRHAMFEQQFLEQQQQYTY